MVLMTGSLEKKNPEPKPKWKVMKDAEGRGYLVNLEKQQKGIPKAAEPKAAEAKAPERRASPKRSKK